MTSRRAFLGGLLAAPLAGCLPNVAPGEDAAVGCVLDAGAPVDLPIVVKMRQSNCGGQPAMPSSPVTSIPDVPSAHFNNSYPRRFDQMRVEPLHYRPLDTDDGLYPGRLNAGGEVELITRLAEHGRLCGIATSWAGSTGWSEWRPDMQNHRTSWAIRFVDIFVERLASMGIRGHVCAVVYTGGEQEASGTGAHEIYQHVLETEAWRWRARYGDGLPFIVDRLREDIERARARIANVRAGEEAAAAEDPNMLLVDTDPCELLPDVLHYSPDGLALKGRLAADAIASLPALVPNETTHMRADMFASDEEARATVPGAEIRRSPVERIWAAECPGGKHWISRTGWLLA